MNRGPTGNCRDHNRALEIHCRAFLIPGMTFYCILLNETEQSSASPFRQSNYHQNSHIRLREKAYIVLGQRMGNREEKHAYRTMFFSFSNNGYSCKDRNGCAHVCLYVLGGGFLWKCLLKLNKITSHAYSRLCGHIRQLQGCRSVKLQFSTMRNSSSTSVSCNKVKYCHSAVA